MPRKRNIELKVYLSKDEKQILSDKMKKVGYTNMSEFIRKAITVGTIVNLDTKYLSDLNYEINKIGVNINQVAKKVNTTGSIYKSDIENIKTNFNKVVDLISVLNNAASVINKN